MADVGCGAGWSTIGLKQAYPTIEAHGIEEVLPVDNDFFRLYRLRP